jgi:serine/threonine protein kinase
MFYYAMEYLDGLNLEQLVAKYGRQAPARVAHILRQVCGALTEAHAVGLIHRDIKPANIILSERGGLPDVAKVVDFGLVKSFETAPNANLEVTSANLIVGTPLYMAPEAIGGNAALDGRCDLYALGAVGYFLLTGAPVFQAKSQVEIFAHHLHTQPDPPSVRTGALRPRRSRTDHPSMPREETRRAIRERARPSARARPMRRAHALGQRSCVAVVGCVQGWVAASLAEPRRPADHRGRHHEARGPRVDI